MAEENGKDGDGKEAVLTVYDDYDVGGGGLPFGHVRAFRVDLKIKGAEENIVRYKNAGYKLLNKITTAGVPVSDKKSLPSDKDYSTKSYEQLFMLPNSLTQKQIESEIPYESVL
jgi:hypothetical protein